MRHTFDHFGLKTHQSDGGDHSVRRGTGLKPEGDRQPLSELKDVFGVPANRVFTILVERT